METSLSDKEIAEAVKERIVAAVRVERNYWQILLFFAFTALYILALYLQSSAFRAGEVTSTLKGLLLPDSGPSATFHSNAEVLDYIEQRLVQPFWTDPPCGDGECTPPSEFPAWGRFGCRADCGLEPNTTNILVKVSSNFAGHPLLAPRLLMALATWNMCLQRSEGSLCWFEQDQTFQQTAAVRVETMEVATGSWYILVNGDYAGRVSGAVFSLDDQDNPVQLSLTVRLGQ